MIVKRTRINRVIATGILIMTVTWSMNAIADLFMGNPDEITIALLEPGAREAAKWLAIIMIVIGVVGYFLQNEKKQKVLIEEQDDLYDLIGELKHNTRTLKTLKSLLPTCPSCDGIRDDLGSWYEPDIYMKKYPETIFAEEYCPGCSQKMRKETSGLSRKDKHPLTRRA